MLFSKGKLVNTIWTIEKKKRFSAYNEEPTYTPRIQYFFLIFSWNHIYTHSSYTIQTHPIFFLFFVVFSHFHSPPYKNLLFSLFSQEKKKRWKIIKISSTTAINKFGSKKSADHLGENWKNNYLIFFCKTKNRYKKKQHFVCIHRFVFIEHIWHIGMQKWN